MGVGALCVAVCDPTSLAVLEAPGKLGADVAVGECQPLGMPLLYGGPYAGYMATHEANARQLPGRISGRPWTGTASSPTSSPSAPASRTSGAQGPTPTSAPTRRLRPSPRSSIPRSWAGGDCAKCRALRLEGALYWRRGFGLPGSSFGIPTRRSCGSLRSKCRT